MQFHVVGRDGDDAEALQRRLAARDNHIALGDKLFASGNMLFGVALLDDEGTMVGSSLIVDFPSRRELDEWLAVEPYVIGKVWQSVEVTPCRIGPSFVGLLADHSASNSDDV